ncbi:MAG: hypothetical protein ACOCUP_01045 [bacterium]
MSAKIYYLIFLPFISLFFINQNILAQENISWLEDYTTEMPVGNDTYRYKFTNVEGNDCKIKIEEMLTDKKGSTESRYWEFYLSDIDPATLKFNPKKKSIIIEMETKNSQEFISYYEEGEFDEYTEEIELSMNEVDMARSFIEALRENIDQCKESEVSWNNREEAFNWLTENIGEAMDDDVKWEQEFKEGERSYLVEYFATSTDDGEQEMFNYVLDLNDINPLAISLDVSGKTLSVEVPVRDGEKYIELKGPDGKEYTDELIIYADDIEEARKILNALSYLVSNTMPERPSWDSYTAALEFVQQNLGEVKIDDDSYQNSLQFEEDPAGIVDLTVRETDDEGETEEVSYSFYLFDMIDKLNLDVSKNEITVEMETKDDRDFIRETEGESVSGYESDLEFHMAEIDNARDVINAFETAIRNSEEVIVNFQSVDEVNFWLVENFVTLYREDEKYEQKLEVMKENENLLTIERTLTEEDDGEIILTVYQVYPEDINLDELEIKVSGGRLTVPVQSDKDFIREYGNEQLNDYTDDAEVYFADPLVAKNFIAALRYLKEISVVEDRSEMTRQEALDFLIENIPDIKLTEKEYEQKIELLDNSNCKMKFTRLVTEEDGEKNEYIYEFLASDIHKDNSEISVDDELIEVTLVTAGERELIKPYENGEVEDFESEFSLYADDVVLGKKILGAFAALSKECGK